MAGSLDVTRSSPANARRRSADQSPACSSLAAIGTGPLPLAEIAGLDDDTKAVASEPPNRFLQRCR
jgi:hypothetical protein